MMLYNLFCLLMLSIAASDQSDAGVPFQMIGPRRIGRDVNDVKKKVVSLKDREENAGFRADRSTIHTTTSSLESEIFALSRKVNLLENDEQKYREILRTLTAQLDDILKSLTESERLRKDLANTNSVYMENITNMTKQLTKVTNRAEDVEKRFKDTAKMLGVTELELEVCEDRLEASNYKISELEDELRVIGNNLKSLENSEAEAAEREKSYGKSIQELTVRVKIAERRVLVAEAVNKKLQKEVDHLEDDLLGSKMTQTPSNMLYPI